MTWINFLHFYQPANIEDFYIKEALDKSYYRLLRLVQENPDLKITINITACLLLRLEGMGENGFINSIKRLYEEERIEITSSAAYHGLLPLLPEGEIRKQIQENEDILKKFFGSDFKAKGFFLPEMAYSKEVAKIIKDFSYDWIILDEISAKDKKIDFQKPYIDKDSGLKVIFRNRKASRSYPPDYLINALQNDTPIKTIITATDAELYGLRHQDPTGEMEKVAKEEKIESLFVSEFISSFDNNLDKIKLRTSSWESEEVDILEGKPLVLWFDKNNKIHRYLWKLSYLALEVEKKFPEGKNIYWCRWHLVRGLASCTFWWASDNDFSESFGSRAWNPDIVERGLEDLIRSIRSLGDKESLKYKLKAEKLYLKIKKNLWRKHWLSHWS